MFIWSDTFNTNIELVDLQHKNLFQLLNKLSLNIKQDNISYEDVNNSIKLLIHYTENHLRDEELLMMESRIDKRHLTKHRMEHNSFLYDVGLFSDITSSDDRRITRKATNLVRFITYWLIFHILGTDMLMSAQLTNIKAGMSPQQAFDMLKDHKIDPATVNLMLDAIINLWLDAKERCNQMEIKVTELQKTIESLQSKQEPSTINQSEDSALEMDWFIK
ncbi:MAG: hypothetical protein DM484_12355 [Candidatus Methylumidiphilus alinenensis]|uniref:Hemerythrin-like domain-containing protein n=1 Tax=Candidatus Methylumidiphilus alinenensis TaxID=2202197 RepID=A0A2W4R977_9GAMM|nr:MAG: hypothetical protein DM484_12355 [Candidatus Methylumidiphilus alinenensis]